MSIVSPRPVPTGPFSSSAVNIAQLLTPRRVVQGAKLASPHVDPGTWQVTRFFQTDQPVGGTAKFVLAASQAEPRGLFVAYVPGAPLRPAVQGGRSRRIVDQTAGAASEPFHYYQARLLWRDAEGAEAYAVPVKFPKQGGGQQAGAVVFVRDPSIAAESPWVYIKAGAESRDFAVGDNGVPAQAELLTEQVAFEPLFKGAEFFATDPRGLDGIFESNARSHAVSVARSGNQVTITVTADDSFVSPSKVGFGSQGVVIRIPYNMQSSNSEGKRVWTCTLSSRDFGRSPFIFYFTYPNGDENVTFIARAPEGEPVKPNIKAVSLDTFNFSSRPWPRPKS